MSDGIKATPNKTDIAAQQIHDFTQGIDDTVTSIREYLAEIDINADDAGFKTSATTRD